MREWAPAQDAARQSDLEGLFGRLRRSFVNSPVGFVQGTRRPPHRGAGATRPAALTAKEFATHCATHLAPCKVPRSFTSVGQLPVGPTGKVLKRELEAMLR